jgi:hypothetical protein
MHKRAQQTFNVQLTRRAPPGRAPSATPAAAAAPARYCAAQPKPGVPHPELLRGEPPGVTICHSSSSAAGALDCGSVGSGTGGSGASSSGRGPASCSTCARRCSGGGGRVRSPQGPSRSTVAPELRTGSSKRARRAASRTPCACARFAGEPPRPSARTAMMGASMAGLPSVVASLRPAPAGGRRPSAVAGASSAAPRARTAAPHAPGHAPKVDSSPRRGARRPGGNEFGKRCARRGPPCPARPGAQWHPAYLLARARTRPQGRRALGEAPCSARRGRRSAASAGERAESLGRKHCCGLSPRRESEGVAWALDVEASRLPQSERELKPVCPTDSSSQCAYCYARLPQSVQIALTSRERGTLPWLATPRKNITGITKHASGPPAPSVAAGRSARAHPGRRLHGSRAQSVQGGRGVLHSKTGSYRQVTSLWGWSRVAAKPTEALPAMARHVGTKKVGAGAPSTIEDVCMARNRVGNGDRNTQTGLHRVQRRMHPRTARGVG